MLVILSRWDNKGPFNIHMSFEREEDMKRTYKGLVLDAKKNGTPVEYKMDEVPGELNYEDKKEVEDHRGKMIIFDKGRKFALDIDKKE